MRKLFTLLLSLLLVFSLTIPAFAAPVAGTLQIDGKDAIYVTPHSDYHDTDLFGSQFKNIMPGDTLQAKVIIKADFSQFYEDSIKITIEGVAHDEQGNPLKYDEAFEFTDGKDQENLEKNDPAGIDGIRDETVASMTEFLSRLDLKITDVKKNKVIFEDKASAILGKQTFDRFRNKGQVELLLELYWDPNGDYDYNQYANRVGEIDWLITVSAYDDPTVDNPKTGDYIMMAVAVMAVSAAALVIILVIKRKKK